MLSVGVIAALTMRAVLCPSEEGVESYLRRSTPPDARARYQWSASIDGHQMKLTLRDAGGAVVRARNLPAAVSCDERESVAAAVLAAWMMSPPTAPVPTRVAVTAPAEPAPVSASPQKAPERVAPPPASSSTGHVTRPGVVAPAAPVAERLPDPPAEAPVASSPAATPEPMQVAVATPGTPRAGLPAPPAPSSSEPEPDSVTAEPASLTLPSSTGLRAELSSSSSPPSLTQTETLRPASGAQPFTTWRFDVAADLRAQYAATAAPGLGVRVSGGRSLGAFLEASSALPRNQSLGTGEAQWWRVALGAGAHYRAQLPWLWLEPALSIEAAWVHADGRGFVKNGSAEGFDASACAHLRAGRPVAASLSVYLGARACVWPLNNQIAVTAVDQKLPMPRFELGALLGLSLGFPLKGSYGSRPEGS